MLILEYEHLFPDIPTRTYEIAHDVDVEDSKPVKQHPTSNFIAGRPKAALLFWFFGDFRGGVSLFIVIRVIYKYKNR